MNPQEFIQHHIFQQMAHQGFSRKACEAQSRQAVCEYKERSDFNNDCFGFLLKLAKQKSYETALPASEDNHKRRFLNLLTTGEVVKIHRPAKPKKKGRKPAGFDPYMKGWVIETDKEVLKTTPKTLDLFEQRGFIKKISDHEYAPCDLSWRVFQ